MQDMEIYDMLLGPSAGWDGELRRKADLYKTASLATDLLIGAKSGVTIFWELQIIDSSSAN